MTSAVIAVLAVSCDKTEPVEPDDPKTPDPELSLQESIEVPADGGVFSITYTIENQNDSLNVEASSESNEWIHSFDCSVPGTISFTVDEYTGEQDIEFSLSPETEYAAVAMAASLQGIVFSEVSTAEFKTNKANLSDNKISIDVEIIDSYTYWFKISTTNSDPYTWGCQPSSKYEGMSDEEMLEYLLQDPFIGLNVRSGDVESNMGATPGNTYTLHAFGYANGTATTDLKRVEFTMPEE